MTSRAIHGSTHRRPQRFALAAIAGLLVATALTGCGSSSNAPDTSNVDFNSLSMDQLYAKAKEEGEVIYSSGADDDDVKILAEGFDKLYPGIKIVHSEEQGEDSAAKLAAEEQAGAVNTDLIDTEQNTAYALQQSGLLADYTPPNSANFDASLKFPAITGYRIQIKVITYNTDKVSADEAPKTYDDLLDPKWKDQVCVEQSEVSTFADMIQDWGKDKALDYWTKLTANGLRFIKGQSDLVAAVVAGDCTISVAANVHSIAQSQADGAPIAWVKTDPMYANFGAFGVVKNAPHPYAARLWENYLLSDEGQQAVANDYRIPANTDVEPKEPELQRGTFNLIIAGQEVMTNFTDYNNLWYTTTGRPVVAPE